MGYNSSGRKPIEFAGKTGHIDFINEENKAFLKECYIPQENIPVSQIKTIVYNFQGSNVDNIKYVIAIDGGVAPVKPKKKYPSSEFAAINIGILLLEISKFESLQRKPFISPNEFNKVKNIGKSQLLVPIKNIMHPAYETFSEFVRGTIYKFFIRKEFNLASTLKWLAFREFLDSPVEDWNLARHPYTDEKNITLKRRAFDENFIIWDNDKPIYITDILRLHELIDENIGAQRIVDYLLSAIEQIMMVSIIREILTKNFKKLSEFLFILDRPLAFFGQTANLHKPMRDLISYIASKGINLHIVGLEKSGAFVEHAQALKEAKYLKRGQYILLSNDYIYSHIVPKPSNPDAFYGRSTYYGGKVIFFSKEDNINVCTIPMDNYENIKNPKPENFLNLITILTMLEKLKCDMYENAILPISLINSDVSISKYPGEISIEKFIKDIILKPA